MYLRSEKTCSLFYPAKLPHMKSVTYSIKIVCVECIKDAKFVASHVQMSITRGVITVSAKHFTDEWKISVKLCRGNANFIIYYSCKNFCRYLLRVMTQFLIKVRN